MTFLGLWFSYFTSFILGYLPSLVSGTAAAFYFVAGPYGKAVLRNMEDGRGEGGGVEYVFVGVIEKLEIMR